MRKLNLKLIMLMVAAIPMLLFTSCDDDKVVDEEEEDFQPVLNENFGFIVDGNDVLFSTTLTGNVLVTSNDVEYPMVDKKVTVNLPNKGIYTFTCSSLGSGAVLTSEPFEVEIEQDDLGFLDEGLWKYLSGGANQTKTWRLDITAEAKLEWFAGPMYFSGYAVDGQPKKEEWSYWAWDVLPEDLPVSVNGVEQNSLVAWAPDYAGNPWIMAAKDYGTITFDATNGTVSTEKFGQTVNGSFTFDPETMKLGFGGGIILPIDTARINEPQFLEENLANLRIFSLTDSAMQIGIKRSYDGIKEDDSHPEDPWILIYNFIVVGYTYEAEVFTYTEPVNTSFTAEDLVGTWKYDAIAQDWIGWSSVGSKGTTSESKRLNAWTNRAELVATIDSWDNAADAAAVEAVFTAADANEFVFNNDGTCTLAGVDNTYTVANGVITFGTALTNEISLYWIGITGTEAKVLDVKEGVGFDVGLWIGNQNETKNESATVHWVKQ